MRGNGAGLTTINAGVGGSDNGLFILNGTGLTSAININGAAVRAMTAAALGTGAITMINPTLQFAATDTYNNISLAASSPTTDPTNLQTFGTGVTATLGGAITQAIAGQPLVFSSVDINGTASTGTFVLTNTGNSWTGLTTVSAGTTLSGAYNTISGGSITNDGWLVYMGGAGSVLQNINGSGDLHPQRRGRSDSGRRQQLDRPHDNPERRIARYDRLDFRLQHRQQWSAHLHQHDGRDRFAGHLRLRLNRHRRHGGGDPLRL